MWTEADSAAASIAEQQLGVVHRVSLEEVGLSQAMIDRRLKRGLLVRRGPAVYSFAGSPHTDAQNAVVEALSVDARAAISHDSAAFHWRLIDRRPNAVHVVVRRWAREHRSTCSVHESLDFVPTDRVWSQGMPVTTAVRSVVDLGATSPWLVERALSAGLRTDLFDLVEVAAFVDRVARRGRRGVGVIRPYLAMHRVVEGKTESLLEDMFLRVLYERSIRLPIAQYTVVDSAGVFVCRADFAYADLGILIELDGRSYHSDVGAFQRDRDKQNRTQALGWRTVRFTWDDVYRAPDRTATTIEGFLGATQPVLA